MKATFSLNTETMMTDGTSVPRRLTVQEAKHSWTCAKETWAHLLMFFPPRKMGPDTEGGVGRADLTVTGKLKGETR